MTTALGKNRRAPSLSLISLVAGIGGMLFGYDTGVISGALLFIREDFHTDNAAEQTIVAILLIGAMIGAWAGGRFSDRHGRKPVVLATAALYLGGVVIAALAPHTTVLIVARFVLGLGVGASAQIIPIYIAEITPAEKRGAMISRFQLMVAIGVTVSAIVSYLLADAGAWRWMLGIAALPSLLLLLGFLPMPESPNWLAQQGRTREAAGILRQIRPAGSAIDSEIDDVRRTYADEAKTWREAMARAGTRAITIGVVFGLLQQLGGVNTVIYYAPTVLTNVGLSAQVALLTQVIIGVFGIGVLLLAGKLVDRIGRRPLLLGGTAGMVTMLVSLAGAFHAFGNDIGAPEAAVATVLMLLYITAFNLSVGPIFWILCSEIYPASVRGRAMGMAVIANWFGNFLVSETYLTLNDTVGRSGAFLVFATTSAITFLFILKFIPETKGRSMEEIAESLHGRDSLATRCLANKRD